MSQLACLQMTAGLCGSDFKYSVMTEIGTQPVQVIVPTHK